MKKPPQELIDAFFKWYSSHPHSKNEDYYRETIKRDHLSKLSKPDFIDFFHKFADEGGQVQSGGNRTSGRFRQTIESNYDQFRSFVLNPFDADFDEAKWLARRKDFDFFGVGLATIYLNRVDKKRFPILNNNSSRRAVLPAEATPFTAHALFSLDIRHYLIPGHQHVKQLAAANLTVRPAELYL